MNPQLKQANFRPRTNCITARKARTNLVRRKAQKPVAKLPSETGILYPSSKLPGGPLMFLGTRGQWYRGYKDKGFFLKIWPTIGDEIYEYTHLIENLISNWTPRFEPIKYDDEQE